ncbi:MAG: hypothetical protein HZC41_23305 [Chloroflexi bacterium]|nr:hypothetical protein [Chloroflexota bacterium]
MFSPSPDFEQQSYYDYSRARFWAAVRGILNWLLRKRNDLLALDTLLENARIQNQHAVGVCVVPINQIVGSSGRTGDFDRAFYPRRGTTQEKWVSVSRASREGVALPPVELRKVGEQYFVVDGHHRISVARQHGQHFIDAHVVEMVIARRM